MHIAVAGNIGAGKTTLTRLLAKHYKWEPHFEDVGCSVKRINALFDDIRRGDGQTIIFVDVTVVVTYHVCPGRRISNGVRIGLEG